jgi:hypothetical protein
LYSRLLLMTNQRNPQLDKAVEVAKSNIFSCMIPSLASQIPTKKSLIIKQTILSGMYISLLFGSYKAEQANMKNPQSFNREAQSTAIAVTAGLAATGVYASIVWLLSFIFYYEQFALSHEHFKIGSEKRKISNGGPTYDDLELDMQEFVNIGSTIQKYIEGWTVTSMVLFFASLTLASPFSFLLGHAGYMLFQRYLVLNAKQGAELKLKAINSFTGNKTV